MGVKRARENDVHGEAFQPGFESPVPRLRESDPDFGGHDINPVNAKRTNHTRIRMAIIEVRALRRVVGGSGAVPPSCDSSLSSARRPKTGLRPAAPRAKSSPSHSSDQPRPKSAPAHRSVHRWRPRYLRSRSDAPARRGVAETRGLASPACGSSSYAKLPGVTAAVDNRNGTVMECRPVRTAPHDMDLAIPRARLDEPG